MKLDGLFCTLQKYGLDEASEFNGIEKSVKFMSRTRLINSANPLFLYVCREYYDSDIEIFISTGNSSVIRLAEWTYLSDNFTNPMHRIYHNVDIRLNGIDNLNQFLSELLEAAAAELNLK